MFSVQTEIIIKAPPHTVRDVLLDMPAYQAWSTMLHYEGGTPRLGEILTLRLTPPEGAAYSFSPEIIALDEPKKFAWVGRTGFAGVFDGTHIFELYPHADNSTRLVNKEDYSGLLSPIIKRIGVLKGAEPGFQQMNKEIKARAESLVDTTK
ncbi:MAG: SRPBCC domain-containing protein [Chloroflexota bacterium]